MIYCKKCKIQYYDSDHILESYEPQIKGMWICAKCGKLLTIIPHMQSEAEAEWIRKEDK